MRACRRVSFGALMDRLHGPLEESSRGSPQEKDVQEQDAFASCSCMASQRGAAKRVPTLWRREAASPGVRTVRLVRRSASPRYRLSQNRVRSSQMAKTGPGS